jgi:hypothetical protein
MISTILKCSHTWLLALLLVAPAFNCLQAQPLSTHNLRMNPLPAAWDEGFPLGNGILGCLIWQHDGKLRLSLDRADLWDLRPMRGLDRPEFNYKWVAERAAEGAKSYQRAQEYFDQPYEQEAGPTKLPGAALEFGTKGLGAAAGELDIATGMATIRFPDSLTILIFVDANRREGRFRIQGGADGGRQMADGGAHARDLNALIPVLLPPKYNGNAIQPAGGSVAGDDLARLGYKQAEVFSEKNVWVYHQPCWGAFSYEVALGVTKAKDGALEGVWSISSHFPQKPESDRAFATVRKALKKSFADAFKDSRQWWSDYWSASTIRIPDPLIERQYYLDMYKFGCVARANAPMISLQAVWTADNGRLPPWKGDFHHDLNTQLSYWPAYTANHLDQAMGYLNHLESNDAAHRKYTRQYFGTPGLNVPGVETLLGEPMGGWIQYSCSPTTACWLTQHFYLQWRYSQDRAFLKAHAYPFLKDVATHLEAVSQLNKAGVRVLPMSSSPEINDNSVQAWFPNTWTNYDLALARFTFGKTAELATELGKEEEAAHWQHVLGELPGFATTPKGDLKFAPSLDYKDSHRHFSHLLAIHPLGLIDWHSGQTERKIIRASLNRLDSVGTAGWTGYSFAWLANIRARAHDGEGARTALRIFAEAFVSKNSFHVNGDQSGKGYSASSYRPFTLEGNFAAAAGLHEMLMQSYGGVIEVFPAVPAGWVDASFHDLRAEGAFLVSAERKGGQTVRMEVRAEQAGQLKIRLPGNGMEVLELSKDVQEMERVGDVRQFAVKKGGVVRLGVKK